VLISYVIFIPTSLKQSNKHKVKFYKNQIDCNLKIFICGPTLYEKCHIGHARIFIFFNFLINYHRFIGNSPIAIMQLTDIDHKIYQKVDYKGSENLKIPDIYLS
jgi:cysteinyl-tRNA synthetase